MALCRPNARGLVCLDPAINAYGELQPAKPKPAAARPVGALAASGARTVGLVAVSAVDPPACSFANSGTAGFWARVPSTSSQASPTTARSTNPQLTSNRLLTGLLPSVVV